MNNTYKEVYFNEWCSKCKYEETPETEDPCDDCLAERKREYSHKPAKFEEKE